MFFWNIGTQQQCICKKSCVYFYVSTWLLYKKETWSNIDKNKTDLWLLLLFGGQK